MPEAPVSIVPLTETTCKVVFINYNAPRTDGMTQITYDSNNFNVIQDGIKRNHWCVVEASYADFGNNSRVIVEYT
jgi:hypothetical protein